MSSSTAAREPIRSPSEPTAAGSAADGTARQTRSHPGELDVAGALDGDGLGQARPRAGSVRSRAWRRSPPPSPGSGSRAGPRVRREPAARPSRCPSSRRRSPRPCAAAAGRRATPTGARCWARSEPVTVAASAGEGCSVRGKVSGRPTRSFTLRGRIRQPRRTCSCPCTATGRHRGAGLQRQAADAALRRPQRARPDPRPLGEDADRAAAVERRAGRSPWRSRPIARAGSGRRRAGRGAIRASGARTARPWRRTASGGATEACSRSRTDRGSCGGWRRRSTRP